MSDWSMIDWTASVQRSYEYYTVDPGTWGDDRRLEFVKVCSITRDSTAETLGSASFTMDENIGECYVRTYMVTSQNGVRERIPLGTHLLQTFPSKFNGTMTEIQVDAYTPLIELKEKLPPIGFHLKKDDKINILDAAYSIISENVRAPVVKTQCDKILQNDFAANTDDNWLTFVIDLLALADYELDLDELGRIMFAPVQNIEAIKPIWKYTDDNSSILYPDLSISNDLYNVPNTIEVIYSTDKEYCRVQVVNDDPNSPVSTVNRGRVIMHRDTSPSIAGTPDPREIQHVVQEYAENLLKSMSTLSHNVTYSHGYCPVRIRDGVRLEYNRSGLKDVNAKVITQTIDCTPACKVSETAVFVSKLWGTDEEG